MPATAPSPTSPLAQLPLSALPLACPVPREYHAALRAHAAAYAGAQSWSRSTFELLITLLPYLGLQYLALWPTFPLAVALRVRLFILAHDMAHGAYFPSPTLNHVGASLLMPAAAYTPASFWRRTHGYHHLHVNDLDALDAGWTTAGYAAASWPARAAYAGMHSRAAFLSGVVPAAFYFVAQQVAPGVNWWEWAIEVLVIFAHTARGTLAWDLATATAGAGIGMLLFNVQHTFRGTWRGRSSLSGDWDPVTSAVHGSSLLVLPRWAAWVTAGLEFHHVHHLNARVPCYALAECHAAAGAWFDGVPRVAWWEAVAGLPYCLWDEARRVVARADEVVVKKRRVRVSDEFGGLFE
ncbi:hypothetical protein H9P43_004902 [Blastocladiella emersonii ATCC 22665]|nr:hypothetical protein H9P43_004902 [Blastocladiella emersonii ATCC 22665]